ncbi:hypothetical protein FS749_003690 [Ceratobasidium sp. UAMH 11750]|nr:hypothetical protein FS749_003690 [Ceratobasidium sp. UAMH 11750]
MHIPISLPSNTPIPQQMASTSERYPDKGVMDWIESLQQTHLAALTGSADAEPTGLSRVQSELPPLARPPMHLDEGATSSGGSTPDAKDQETNDRISSRPPISVHFPQANPKPDETSHSIPPSTAPVGLFADLALNSSRSRRESDVGASSTVEEEASRTGVANLTYFEAGPSADPELRRMIIERQMPPEILTHGIIKQEEVEILFRIYFEKLNPHIGILDPNMHTPSFVFGRCPFLFTVICAISSHYYRERPELYAIAMYFAKQLAAKALIEGRKSIELVQAYTLMSAYPIPAHRWEEDRTWLYLSLAIKIATDLNLHLPWQGEVTGEAQEREVLNRTRTWLVCFYLDQSGATQIGRPPSIREDHLILKSHDRYWRSAYNLPTDIHLLAYARILWVAARFLTAALSNPGLPAPLDKSVDLLSLADESDKELMALESEIHEQFATESDHNNPACEYRCNLLPFLSNYSRLVIFSFVFQEAFQHEPQHAKVFFDMCYKAASEVVRTAVEVLVLSKQLMYAPDEHFVFISFATAFLIKMLRPEFAPFLEPTQSKRIMQLVVPLPVSLASDMVAIDNQHCPLLYSRFLSGLIGKLVQGGLALDKPEAGPADNTMDEADAALNSNPVQKTYPQENASDEVAPEGGDRKTSAIE